jgi:hypothetical protein
MSRMGLGMRVSWRDVEQVGGQERNDLRHRKNGSIVLLERKKGGHVGKNGTEVERPSPTEVGQLTTFNKNLYETFAIHLQQDSPVGQLKPEIGKMTIQRLL